MVKASGLIISSLMIGAGIENRDAVITTSNKKSSSWQVNTKDGKMPIIIEVM